MVGMAGRSRGLRRGCIYVASGVGILHSIEAAPGASVRSSRIGRVPSYMMPCGIVHAPGFPKPKPMGGLTSASSSSLRQSFVRSGLFRCLGDG